MRPKDCAYIVERLAIRFMALVTDHERQLTEHRAAFGARTEADAKIIAGLRSEIVAARMAVLERDSLMSERDGLLIQVQDMRAEINRLTGHNADAALHDLLRREYDKALTLCETDEQTPAECIGSLNARIDRLQDDARSDARVREDLHRINVELRAEVAFLKIRDREYEKALDLCDKEEQTPAECIAALQEWMRASIVRGDFEQMEVAALKSQSPHPVKVGEWVKASNGAVAQVLEVHKDWYLIARGHGWTFANCEPCDPPNHDTEAGKAAAEAALKTEPVAEEIKVGDVVEVVSHTGRNTWLADVGSVGTVVTVEEINDSISVCLDDVPGKKNALAGYVSFCDVRKVTT